MTLHLVLQSSTLFLIHLQYSYTNPANRTLSFSSTSSVGDVFVSREVRLLHQQLPRYSSLGTGIISTSKEFDVDAEASSSSVALRRVCLSTTRVMSRTSSSSLLLPLSPFSCLGPRKTYYFVPRIPCVEIMCEDCCPLYRIFVFFTSVTNSEITVVTKV